MDRGAEAEWGQPAARSFWDSRMSEGPGDLLMDTSRLEQLPAVSQQRESLGTRVRKARESRGLTIRDLSNCTGIDPDTLSSVESNQMVPTLAALVKLGKALETRMGFFISPGVDKALTIVRAHERQPFSRYGEERSERYGYFYESLAPEKANRVMEPFLVTLLPTEAEELSTHDGQEFIFVLEGEMKVQVGDQVEFLRSGDALYYDSTQPHFVKCVGGQETKILAIIYPGLK